MSTNFTARARERSKLPVTGTIDHYVSWLNREIYGGKLREQDPTAVAGMSITPLQPIPENRGAPQGTRAAASRLSPLPAEAAAACPDVRRCMFTRRN